MTDQPTSGSHAPSRAIPWGRWIAIALGASGLLVVGWVAVTAWWAIVHGHPLYAALLAVTLLGSGWALARSWRGRGSPTRRPVLHAVLLVCAAAWIVLVAWLRPFPATEPALGALRSDTKVIVTESSSLIVLAPVRGAGGTGLLFQPGARVDPRAASYPAGDLTSLRAPVLSVSGTRDGLATPDEIAASRDRLPAATEFMPVDGAVHASFGDYGPQPGDGTPSIDRDRARAQISTATVAFVQSLGA